MKKVLSFYICLMVIAASASADFKRDPEFQAKMNPPAQDTNTLIKPDQVAQKNTDARSVALENALAPLYAEIADRKANGQPTDDLWAQVLAIRATRGFDVRTNSGNLDQGGETCVDAYDLGSALGPNVDSGTTMGYANDFGPYTTMPACWQGPYWGASTAGSPDVTYKWTAPFTSSFTFSTCNGVTNYDSGLELYIMCSNIAGPVFLCGNDDACGALTSQINCYPLQAGQQVLIVVDGFGVNPPLTGNYQLDISCCFQCPPNAIRSQEPDCGPNYVDIFNSGCSLPGTTLPPAFEPIECNTTICATGGRWEDAAGVVYYDEDWYVLSLTAQTQIRLCGATDAYGAIALYSGVCPSPAFIDSVEFGGGCTPQCLTLCLPAGVYYIQAFLLAPCGTPYAVSVACHPCDDCHTDDPIFVDVSGGLPACDCITLLCANTPYILCIGPLGPNEMPNSGTVTPGCPGIPIAGIPVDPCDVDCPPTMPIGLSPWIYNPATSSWCIRIGAQEAGCFCFCLDDVLPVELNEFNAVAGDGEVALNWSTASESDNDHFDIMRDGSLVGRVNATNSPTGNAYHWSDQDLNNGRSYSYDLVSVSISGTRETIANASATPAATAATVTEFALLQNYPNPFNPETSITFDVAEAGLVTLTVYNTVGQTIATLVNGALEVGRHNVSFDAANLPSGLYFYRMDAGQFSAVKKMILMK